MPRAARVAVASEVSCQARGQQNRAQLLQGEIVVKLVQHAPAKIILHAGFLEFVGKQSLDVSGIGHALRLRHKRHGRRERDAMLRADRAGAEGDGGNVSFARGPQTQDETQRALGHPGLVGMRHDGRIEQRRGFWRILVREVSADEHLPFGRRLRAGFEMNLHLREAFAENIFNVFMPVRKFAEHLAHQPGNFLFRQGHDPRDDSPRDVIGGGTKRAQQHPRTIRDQGRPDASGVEGG